ncbi:TetR family transcriptional regulator [Streptomyces boncukensis]|uniref:TetR/AcrR family transcriptional regulator n=1 Tax=Streptomyces boncukensis TaxID=2711219 RepID=A0A6G4XAJ1_9ACTN|nr:TetR/AcrR family transcriptional regulator [Streptomyces boncukensis]
MSAASASSSSSSSSSSRGRTGRPPRTSRAQILQAAWRLIEREGWQKLTMRRLAAEAGAAPTTLYHHVRDKDDLLTQLLNDYADRLPRPELPDGPRERILVAATAMHDSLSAVPWAVEVLAGGDFFGDSALWMVETIVRGAIDCGCTPEQAVDLYRGLWYYTAGEILVRSATERRHAERGYDAYAEAVRARMSRSRLPHMSALADRWAALVARPTYPRGLSAFVDGLLRQGRGEGA